jgi:hypothetical protein
MKEIITKENLSNYQYDKEKFNYCFITKSLIIDLNQGQELSGICIENVIYIKQLKKIIKVIK